MDSALASARANTVSLTNLASLGSVNRVPALIGWGKGGNVTFVGWRGTLYGCEFFYFVYYTLLQWWTLWVSMWLDCREVQQLCANVRESDQVKFAVRIYTALNSCNYVKFFKLVHSATFLNVCILHRYFGQMRACCLQRLRAYMMPGHAAEVSFHSMFFLHDRIGVVVVWCMPSVLWRCWLGSRKGIRPVKNWVVRCWRGCVSESRCRFAYGPADATATHCLLLQ